MQALEEEGLMNRKSASSNSERVLRPLGLLSTRSPKRKLKK